MIRTRSMACGSAGVLVLLELAFHCVAQAPAGPHPISLVMENQFERSVNLADHRGAVVLLVYGDRKGTEVCRVLGEQLHLCWHPSAKGLSPAQAYRAAVVPLPGAPTGSPAPDVCVIPVACCGKVPGGIRNTIRSKIAKGSPDVPVWLDFNDTLKSAFGLTRSEPNVAVFDVAGRLRMTINGTPNQATLDRLVKVVESLRREAVMGK